MELNSDEMAVIAAGLSLLTDQLPSDLLATFTPAIESVIDKLDKEMDRIGIPSL